MNNEITDDLYKKFCDFLEKQSGIVLGNSKQYLVKSRLTPIAHDMGIASLTELIEKSITTSDRQMKMTVIDAMTTNETLWFRDGHPYDILRNKLLPELGGKSSARIWSAASSSGQEPYSIAMTIAEFQKENKGKIGSTKIVGTDISSTMLKHCEEGIYDSLALARGLSNERKDSFFQPVEEGLMQINKDIRSMTSFKQLNLTESFASMGKFDIIFCRNVLIYFAPEIKSKILNQFAGCLNPGGHLMLGASESLSGLTEKFNMVRCSPGIVYQLI